MCESPTQTIFVVVMLIMVGTGAFCAHHLNDQNPCWVRLVVMAPAIVGMFAPVAMLMGVYEPHAFDVVFAVAVALLYALVASRFSKYPWLDLRVSK
jgi:hypothetical protein